MAKLEDVQGKFNKIIGGLETKPDRLFALTGDGKGLVDVIGQTDYVHVRLEDGTYYGVVFNGKLLPPVGDGVPVVVGYSHEQPDLFQILEVRASSTYNSGAAPGSIANVSGLTASWQQDDCLITWTALPYTPLLHNYRVTIDGVDYLPTTNRLLYTRTMNQDDHGGTWDSSLNIEVVAVDVYGGISPIPATYTATWTRPVMPDVTSGTATWFQDDCLFEWSDIVRPYTFQNFLVTIGAVTFVALTTSFTYTNAQNRLDHDGVPATTLDISIVAADRDGYTSFVPLVINTTNTNPTGDTLRDNFDTYGGDEIAQNGNEALYWLGIDRMEVEGSQTTSDAHNIVEGLYSQSIPTKPSIGAARRYLINYSPPIDLDQEERFTANDFIVLSAYATDTPLLQVLFGDTSDYSAQTSIVLENGWNYLKFKRSDLAVDVGFDWSAVDSLAIHNGSVGQGAISVDDVRISKADPDDATTFNDTGTAWDFSDGIWHIYQDVPGIPFALGQIDTRSPGARMVALRGGGYAAANHVATGVNLREDGVAGLVAFAQDSLGANAYEVIVDTPAQLLKLQVRVNDDPTTLGQVTVPLTTNTNYTIGLMRVGNQLRAYLSDGTAPIFSAATLKIVVTDTTYYQGRVGLSSYSYNARFFQVRAGSPEHALFAEYAKDADAVDGQHADAFPLLSAANVFEQGATFNESGLDSDFRVESDTEPDALLIDASADKIYLGGLTNGIEISKGGTLRLLGTATVWQDIDFPIIIRTTGANIPILTTLNGNITMPLWQVNDFNVCESQEFVHQWKEGSTCYWHLHLTTGALDASNRYVRFEVEYGYVTHGGVWTFPATLDSGDLLIPANTPAKTMFIFSLGNFTPTGIKIGGHCVARLRRIAATGAAPGSEPWIPMLQMHVECDTLGSNAIDQK